jgi:hypothetical protein
LRSRIVFITSNNATESSTISNLLITRVLVLD